MPLKTTVTEEQFQTMISTFGQYLQLSLESVEEMLDNGEIRSAIANLAQIVSMGNTMGYFRGEDSILSHQSGVLPQTDARKIAATFESDFENRIANIIKRIMDTELANDYIMRMFNYFVVARTVGYKNHDKLTPPVSQI